MRELIVDWIDSAAGFTDSVEAEKRKDELSHLLMARRGRLPPVPDPKNA
jgi:hypothetical protein